MTQLRAVWDLEDNDLPLGFWLLDEASLVKLPQIGKPFIRIIRLPLTEAATP